MIVRHLGTMMAFEGVAALALFAFGRLAPAAKAEVTTSLKATIADASPELAEQLGQAEQFEGQVLAQLIGKGQ